MRESIGSTFIFAIAISFTLIFAGFIVLSLNYSKAYKLKNEMTSMIERYEGLTKNDQIANLGSIGVINKYLNNSGYSTKGKCEYDEESFNKTYASNNLSSDALIEVNSSNQNNQFFYCVSFETNSSCETIFSVTVFYEFGLPLLGNIAKFNISGQSNHVKNAYFGNTQISC